MLVKAEQLTKGQILKVNLERVQDRLPEKLLRQLMDDPSGRWWGGYKLVDGNSFALILELKDGTKSWFFEDELSIEKTGGQLSA